MVVAGPPGEIITREIPEWRIVDDSTWFTVQELTTDRRRDVRAPRPAARYPLSGIGRCGSCGGAIGVTRTPAVRIGACLPTRARSTTVAATYPSDCGYLVKGRDPVQLAGHERKRPEEQAVADPGGQVRAGQRVAGGVCRHRGSGAAQVPVLAYKTRAAEGDGRAASTPPRSASGVGEVRLLPVEVRGGSGVEAAVVEIDVATLRLRVSGGTDPGYVASLVGALRKARC